MLRLLVDFHGVLQTTVKYRDPKTSHINTYSQPMPGSQDAIQRLSNYYDIILVSAMPAEFVHTVGNFLDFYFPEIPSENWVFTYSKHLICGDVMIDDNTSNLKTSECPIKILFGHVPQIKQEYIQFTNWEQLAQYLVDIAIAYWESFTK